MPLFTSGGLGLGLKNLVLFTSLRNNGRKEARNTGDPWPRLEIERSKVKVIMSRQFDACLPITRQTKVAEAPTLAGRLSMCHGWHSASVSRSKGHSSRSPRRITLIRVNGHIFLRERPAITSDLIGTHNGMRRPASFDMRDDLQAETSEWLFKSRLAGGGGITVAHSLLCPAP